MFRKFVKNESDTIMNFKHCQYRNSMMWNISTGGDMA